MSRRDNEPAYDLGRAAAYFVMSNYSVATGQTPTNRQADGAQGRFREEFAADQDFARMGQRGRSECMSRW